MNQDAPIKTVRAYGLGGGGMDALTELITHPERHPAIGYLDAAFADTSDANFEDIHDDSNFYDFGTEKRGSGQVRGANAKEIAEQIPRLLEKFPPAEDNILVATLGGGTGSTALPLLARAIVERGKKVILVGIGIEDSSTTAQNTFDTVKGLDRFSRTIGVAFPLMYAHLADGSTWRKAVADAQFLITSAAILSSDNLRSVDGEDVRSFLDFPRVTGYPPSLSLVRVLVDPEQVSKDAKDAFALIGALKDPEQNLPQLFTDFRKAGYYRTPMPENLYFTNETEGLHELYKRMSALAVRLKEQQTARRAAPTFSNDNDNIDPLTGLVMRK